MCASEYYPPHTAWRASHVLILADDDELAIDFLPSACRRRWRGILFSGVRERLFLRTSTQRRSKKFEETNEGSLAYTRV